MYNLQNIIGVGVVIRSIFVCSADKPHNYIVVIAHF